MLLLQFLLEFFVERNTLRSVRYVMASGSESKYWLISGSIGKFSFALLVLIEFILTFKNVFKKCMSRIFFTFSANLFALSPIGTYS